MFLTLRKLLDRLPHKRSRRIPRRIVEASVNREIDMYMPDKDDFMDQEGPAYRPGTVIETPAGPVDLSSPEEGP